jgi:hypothetical protein
MDRIRFDLPSVEEYLKEQEEQAAKDEMAKHLQAWQESIYVNVGLGPEEAKSIARGMVRDLSTAKGQAESSAYINSIKDKTEKHINTIIGKEWSFDDFDGLILHYKYFRVMVLVLAEMLSIREQEARQLIQDNQRLEQIAKPKLNGLETYRNEIKEQVRQEEREHARQALGKVAISLGFNTKNLSIFNSYYENLEKGGK